MRLNHEMEDIDILLQGLHLPLLRLQAQPLVQLLLLLPVVVSLSQYPLVAGPHIGHMAVRPAD